jgi:hypothetical protein
LYDEAAALAEERQYPRLEIPVWGETFDAQALVVEGPNVWIALLRAARRGGDLETLQSALDQLHALQPKQLDTSSRAPVQKRVRTGKLGDCQQTLMKLRSALDWLVEQSGVTVTKTNAAARLGVNRNTIRNYEKCCLDFDFERERLAAEGRKAAQLQL